jgi:cytoskeletal protein RodZ
MASFGETLKRERELREISLRAVSEATKINIRYLEALEQNRFDALPGGLFNKGFIRAYATFVGIDGEAMVNSYLHEVAGREGSREAGDSGESPPHHRPAELPPRRADPRRFAPSVAAPTPPIVLGPDPPKAAPATSVASSGPSSPPPGPGTAEASAPGVTGSPSPRPAADRNRVNPGAASRSAPYETQRSPAILSISDVDAPERRAPSSRAVAWILSLVAGAALLFLILALLSGPVSSPPETPIVATGGAVADTAESPESPGIEALPPAPGTAAPVVGDSATARTPEVRAPNPRAARPPGKPDREVVSSPPRSLTIASTGGTPPDQTSPGEVPDTGDDGARSAAEKRDEPGPMRVQIETTAPTWVQLSCDAREMINRYMSEGESVAMECLSSVRVSATDAGAVRMAVNDAACLPLGEPGARAYGYTIRIDDHRKICRGAERETYGRP